MKIHHTTPIKELGLCPICNEPILIFWKDKSEKNGYSEQYQERKNYTVHYRCIGGKSLQQLNDERKLLK